MSDPTPYIVPQPHLEPIPGTETYRLIEDWVCWLPYSGKWLTIKAGFVFDGASIPRLLWSWAYPFDPNWVAAALAHDGLYAAELLDKLSLLLLTIFYDPRRGTLAAAVRPVGSREVFRQPMLLTRLHHSPQYNTTCWVCLTRKTGVYFQLVNVTMYIPA